MGLGELDRHDCRVAGLGAIALPIIEQIRTRKQAVEPTPADLPLTAAELASAIGTDATRAGHLLAVACELVERYAPGAPDPVKREAVIRCAGWLSGQPSAAIRSESTGDIATTYMPTHMGALRHSGAMGLLTAWKVRRAGAL